MAGVDVGGGGGKGKRALDSEINMIPMIDLLMVTISFLLITAVWTNMARINADAQVPGPPRPDEEVEKQEPEKQLHVEMRGRTSSSSSGSRRATVISTIDVPRKDDVNHAGRSKLVRYPGPRREDRVASGRPTGPPRPDGPQVRPGHPAHRQRDRSTLRHRRHRRDLPAAPPVQARAAGPSRSRRSTSLSRSTEERARCPFMSPASA